MKTHQQTLLAAALIGALGIGSAQAQYSVLPTPENTASASYGLYPDATGALREAILLNGIPIAFKYDQFWSYSAPLLTALQGDGFIPAADYGTFNFSTGVGNLDVVLSTQAGGTSNQNVGPSGNFDFQDPLDLAGGNPVKWWSCSWGGDPQTCSGNFGNSNYSDAAGSVNGVVTVGTVLDYLQDFDPLNTIPVFYTDWNQTGAADSILFSAKVDLIDPDSNMVVRSWSLDSTNNNSFNAADNTLNFGTLSFCSAATFINRGAYNPISNPSGCAGLTSNGSDYLDLQHNVGSGKPDFIGFAEGMDLSAFDRDLLFVATFNLGCRNGGISGIENGSFTYSPTATLGCNTNGAEEIFLTGRASVPPPNDVPEPGSLALLGLALGLLSWVSTRRTHHHPAA